MFTDSKKPDKNSLDENAVKKTSTLWDRPFIFLNLSFFLVFNSIAFLYLYPLALEGMGNGHHIIGLVMGIFSLAAVISRPFVGKLIVSRGEYRVISLGMATNIVSSLSYCLVTDFGPVMLLVRLIHGVGFSAFIGGSFSLAARAFPPDDRGQAFGVVGASIMCAVALAPPLGEFLISRWGFHALYMAASGSVILAWVAAFLATHPPSPSRQSDKQTDIKYLALFRDRSFLYLLGSTVIFSHCQSTVPNFLALIAAEKGATSGRFFFVAHVVAIIILLTMGKLIDRHGKVLFLRLAYPFLLLGILFIPVMIQSNFFSLSAILYGVGIGFLFPAHNALAAGHGSNMEKPAFMSFFTAVYDSGFITGAILSGWFASQTSLDTLFFACVFLGLIGIYIVIASPIKER